MNESPLHTAASATGQTPPWDSEVVVVSADSRDALRNRIGQLQQALAQNPGVSLADLAATLNGRIAGKHRLAVVAGTVADLQSRLERAQSRLQDDRVLQIRDAAGIYYAESPLYPEGKVAFLFPGEGAQYLNMLGNLSEYFPHIDETLEACDAVGASLPEPMPPLSRFFRFPANATKEERTAAELELRGLGNAMYSVVLADRVLFELLSELGIQADCMAGHSMGEMAALWAAGCFRDDNFPLARIADTVARLESEEDGEPAVLLAVGASKTTVETLVQQTLGCSAAGTSQEVFVAMDNCPHQSVVVGMAEPVAAIEAVLQARRVVFERLALKRPYHTPLFAPLVGSLEDLFSNVDFGLPKTTVYSCSTAEPFPADPNEIRRLSVWHWAMPVEFTRLIENMHASGVRLFIEAGPRGNLSAFVEDILRGKPQLTVPINVPRRSATTQLNHLVAQLAAHHLPIRFAPLYARRQVQTVTWAAEMFEPELAPLVAAEVPAPTVAKPALYATAPVAPAVPGASTVQPAAGNSGRVMAEYLGVMEQFLSTQQSVMQQFLQGRRQQTTSATPPVRRTRQRHGRSRFALPATPRFQLPAEPAPLADVLPSPAPAPVSKPPSYRGPLLGEVVELVPGERIVMRRRLDIEEDLYAQEHTVGGRNVSKLDPNQHGLPVGPMTFSLEIMAELGKTLFPHLHVHGIRNVELMRWLAFDEVEPLTIEVTAKVVPITAPDALLPHATTAIEIEIVDLGNSTNRPPPRMRWVAAKGTLFMGREMLTPPPAGEFSLTGERECRISLESLYQNLFHGEKFQGVERMPRYGEEGIEAEIRVMPRDALLRSNPAPDFIFDPVLADIAMHPLAAWHLEQPDQAGRVLLPFGLESLQLFGPIPQPGTKLISRVSTLLTTTRQFTHAVDVLDLEGRLRMRLTGAKYWRFYVPFGEINFHGPKDEYFISSKFPKLIAGLPGDGKLAAMLLDPPLDVLQPAMRAAICKVAFSPTEQSAFRQLTCRDAEKSIWLFGRMAAKDAVRSAHSLATGERLFPADMELEYDSQGRPVIVHRDKQRTDRLPTVSMAHYKGRYVSIAGQCGQVGCDLIKIDADADALTSILTPVERQLAEQFKDQADDARLRMVSARRAIARALSGDVGSTAELFRVKQLDMNTGRVLVEPAPEAYQRFPQFGESALLVVDTLREDAWIISATLLQGT